VNGELQGTNAKLSTRHSNEAPGSLALNAKVAVVPLATSGGPWSTAVCGASVSTVKPRVAGVGSALPAASTPRTAKT
jgi:hypothetical protein